MATVNPTVSWNGDHTVVTYTYANMTTTNNDGAPFKAPEFADKLVQCVVNTAGTTPTFSVEGSGEFAAPTTYRPLNDTDSTTSAITSIVPPEMKGILENPNWIRPTISGTGTDLTVIFVCRRPSDARQ